MTEADLIRQKIEAWLRHLRAVPADCKTVDRWIVDVELSDIIARKPRVDS